MFSVDLGQNIPLAWVSSIETYPNSTRMVKKNQILVETLETYSEHLDTGSKRNEAK